MFAVRAILEAPDFDTPPPDWRDIVLTWDELRVMPTRWAHALSEWRGVYYIFDGASRQGYIGSASGKENIYGRWAAYAMDGHGGNVALKGRNPTEFRFSILERVSPDLDRAAVLRLESSWKERLHTLADGLNLG